MNIVFIGSLNDDRRKIADELYEKYSSSYRLIYLLYDKKNVGGRICHNSPLTNKQYISIMRESKAIWMFHRYVKKVQLHGHLMRY